MKLFIFLLFVPLTSALLDIHEFLFQYEECNDTEFYPTEAFHNITAKYGSGDKISTAQLVDYINRHLLYDSSYEDTTSYGVDCYTSNLLNSKDDNVLINASAYLKLCPNILNLIGVYRHHYYKKNFIDNQVSEVIDHPSRGLVWASGFVSVTIISLCSLVGISFLPLMKTKNYDVILLYMITLAVGTLSSNAIFQLIPEGFGIDGDPMTVWRSAVIFGGFYLFYLIENILERIFDESHSHVTTSDDSLNEETAKTVLLAGKDSHCVVGDSASITPTSSQMHEAEKDAVNIVETKGLESTDPSNSSICINIIPSSESERSCSETSKSTNKQCWIFRNYKTIKTVAWMITIADGIHNFIDGLAIGASFSFSIVQGISTSLAIFCEEFPHELGDFAILISSGMTVKQAAFYNFTSACSCYLGLIVGILVGDDVSSAQWIFALAGGVFLYISLAGMLPEAQAQCNGKKLRKSPWTCFVVKNLGLQSGFLIMFVLSLYKDKIRVS